MTTQVGYPVSAFIEWYAISDSGLGVGPSIVVPIDTLERMTDQEIVNAVRGSGTDNARYASALSVADNLLCYKREDCTRRNKDAADYLRKYPEHLELLKRFIDKGHSDIDDAFKYADHCLFYFPEKPVTPKVNKTPDVRYELRRKYHETFVKLGRRDGFICQHCGSSDGDLQIDHVHPVSKGGTNDLDNLQLLCAVCNLAKSDTVAEVSL